MAEFLAQRERQAIDRMPAEERWRRGMSELESARDISLGVLGTLDAATGDAMVSLVPVAGVRGEARAEFESARSELVAAAAHLKRGAELLDRPDILVGRAHGFEEMIAFDLDRWVNNLATGLLVLERVRALRTRAEELHDHVVAQLVALAGGPEVAAARRVRDVECDSVRVRFSRLEDHGGAPETTRIEASARVRDARFDLGWTSMSVLQARATSSGSAGDWASILPLIGGEWTIAHRNGVPGGPQLRFAGRGEPMVLGVPEDFVERLHRAPEELFEE